MGSEVLKSLSPVLEKQNRILEPNKNSELYSDILTQTQGEVIQYSPSPFILKGKKNRTIFDIGNKKC